MVQSFLSLLSAITPEAVIWAFPVVFLIHDFEEILTVERWMGAHRLELRRRLGGHRLPNAVLARAEQTNTAQFTTTVACLLLGILAASYLGAGGRIIWFAAILSVLFINVLTHVGQSLAFRGYTPGLITAVFIALPYSLFAYVRLFTSGALTWQTVWASLPLGLVGVAIIFLVGHALGRVLFPVRVRQAPGLHGGAR